MLSPSLESPRMPPVMVVAILATEQERTDPGVGLNLNLHHAGAPGFAPGGSKDARGRTGLEGQAPGRRKPVNSPKFNLDQYPEPLSQKQLQAHKGFRGEGSPCNREPLSNGRIVWRGQHSLPTRKNTCGAALPGLHRSRLHRPPASEGRRPLATVNGSLHDRNPGIWAAWEIGELSRRRISKFFDWITP